MARYISGALIGMLISSFMILVLMQKVHMLEIRMEGLNNKVTEQSEWNSWAARSIQAIQTNKVLKVNE